MSAGKTYYDERGRRYRVMPGLGGDTFKARYDKPGSASWKCVASLPWRPSAEEAQKDLDALARIKGWQEEP